MYGKLVKNLLFYNTILFFFFFLFLFFPDLDIYLSKIFFHKNKFISEHFIFIKDLRVILKELMIIIPIFAIFILFIQMINKSQKIQINNKFRIKYSMIGLIVGPIIGCGVIANLYFKDTWGRARPVHVEEFGGKKYLLQHF